MLTDHFQQIYTHRADHYHRMIAVEDVDGNIHKTFRAISPLEGIHLLDLGSGTGRIPLLFGGGTKAVVALDLNLPMLLEQNKQRSRVNGTWHTLQADGRAIPLASGWSDLTTAGWMIGPLSSWFAANWQQQIGMILREMLRVTRPQGKLVILETMTTGSLTPAPPVPHLAAYYDWLEQTWGFSRQVIATDYQFENVDQAVEYTEFFFGSDLAAKIRANGWSRLPEWTGVWSRDG
jgi:ubiquinone/menaquinone biosynthesis C-methylase UbiE